MEGTNSSTDSNPNADSCTDQSSRMAAGNPDTDPNAYWLRKGFNNDDLGKTSVEDSSDTHGNGFQRTDEVLPRSTCSETYDDPTRLPAATT